MTAALPWIARLGGEPRILDRHTDREVVKNLKGMTSEAEQIVDGIVVVAADAGAAGAGRFGGEIQRLSHHAGFPEQMPVEGFTELLKAAVEVRKHAEAEETV